MYQGSLLFPIFRALLRSLHRYSSVAQGHRHTIHASRLTSVSFIFAIHLLPPSTLFWPYGTHPFFPHAQTVSILSDLLYSLTPFLLLRLFMPNSIHSSHSNQTSKHISRTFTFLLSELLMPHASAPHNAVGTITPSYRV